MQQALEDATGAPNSACDRASDVMSTLALECGGRGGEAEVAGEPPPTPPSNVSKNIKVREREHGPDGCSGGMFFLFWRNVLSVLEECSFCSGGMFSSSGMFCLCPHQPNLPSYLFLFRCTFCFPEM